MTALTNFFLKMVFIGGMFLLLFPNLSFGQTKSEQIDELLNLYLEYGQFNGSVLIAEKGNVIYKKGLGLANMEWDIPNQPDTKHRLGSITKQFTAMLIMQLVVEGKLDLAGKVSEYLPEYPKQNGDQISIHHLLTHSSGTPNYTSFPGFSRNISLDFYRPTEFLSVFADSVLEFTPGSKFSYSNSGYFLLGAIIEQVTGKSYEEMLQQNIFGPLKMNDTGYDHHQTILKNRSTGYEKRGNEFENASYLDMSIPYAAGSIYSTVEDLHRWDQALYTEKLLPQKYLDMMFETSEPGFAGYGYGLSMENMPIGTSEERVETIGHGGGINGFNTLITRIPADKSAIILLNNTGRAPLNDITIAINGILYGKAYDLPRQSLAASLYEVITEEGIASGVAFYEKNKSSDSYSLKENEMNTVGYQLLQAGSLKEAEAVFKTIIEAFPTSFNAYDSYGESLMLQEKRELAIINYKKSIELNPANQNGIEMLGKLGVDTSELTKEIVVPAEILERYVGKYELMPDFILTVTKDGTQMKAQATGQPSFDIFPKSDTVFYLKAIAAQLTFHTNEAGKTESLTLFQNGQEIKGERVSE